MAYDTSEERLKVKGSEQITRDLKVNRDLFVTGDAKIGNNDVLTTADKAVANGVATLDATGRVPYSQLPESAMEYKGTWDASTNTPALVDGTGTNGDFYVVSVEGTVNLGTVAEPRNVTFYVNDRAIYDGTLHEWERLPAGEVRSVNGQTGDVTLTANDINYDSNTTVKAEIDTKADSASLATVATTGDYDDLLNKPNIPPTVIPDTAMSNTSRNPVENKVIKEYVDERHSDYVLGTEQDLHKKWIDGNEIYRKVTKILADGTVFSKVNSLHINQMLVFHDNLYATTNQGLYIVKPTGAEQIGFTGIACDALCIYNDKLYVGYTYGISVSTDGVTFVNNASHPQKAVYTLAVFQNKLYAGGAGSSSYSSLYVSTDGESFSSVSVSSIGTSAVIASIVYEDKLYFGVLSKPMIVTSDGTTFTSYATTTNNTRAFCIYNNKLYAGKLVSEDGDTFTDSGLQATQTTVYGLSVYQGKLYAGVKNSGLYISDDGATFTLNSSMPTGEVCTSFIEYDSVFYIGGWTGLYYAILNLDSSNKSITLPIELKTLLNMELLSSDFKINYTCIQIFTDRLVIYLSSETIASLSPMPYTTTIIEYTKS